MKKKKVLALVLVVALLLTAIGGTLAYFTDTEEAKNVFTVGDVDIELLESQYYTNVHKDKTPDDIRADAKTYADYLANEAGKNVVPGREFNKCIYVDNVGSNAAYIRVRMVVTREQFKSFYFMENTTALEDGTLVKGILAHYPGGSTRDYSDSCDPVTGKTDFTAIKADASWTSLEYIYTYTAPLAGKTLAEVSPVYQFMMKYDLDNEDVAALKANTNILVYADAIQAEGFADYEKAFEAFDGQKGIVTGTLDVWNGEAGELSDDLVIDTAAEFAAFAAAVNAGDTFEGKTVTLNADLHLDGQDWTAIKSFAGTFDGQDHTIFGLNKNLFGTVSGTVKNLNLDSVTRTFSAYTNAATSAFIGTVAEGGLVDNCTVSNVTLEWDPSVKDCGDGISGVIGGVSAGATVQNCEFKNISITAYGKTKRAGGIFSGISGKVLSCVVDGVTLTVTDNNSGDAYFTEYGGGFAAAVNGGAVVEGCTINNITVTADEAFTFGGLFGKVYVSGKTAEKDISLKNINVSGLEMTIGNTEVTYSTLKNIGGFIGQVDARSNTVYLNVDNCHITGLDMTVASNKKGEDPTAGFIASLNGNANITDCSVSGKIDGTKEPIGIGGFLGTIGGHGLAADKGYTVNIQDCTANVAITGNGNIFVGGFVAYAGSYNKTITLSLNFTNCEATGSFYGKIETGTNEVTFFDGKQFVAEGLFIDANGDYLVTSAEGMVSFEKQVNELKNSFSGKTVKLAADVNMAGIDWTPIGQTGATTFKGVFDGNGKTIYNLSVNNSDASANCASGLFGWIESHGNEGVTVKNLTVDGAAVKGHHNVAVIVGYIYGTIENCHVKNAVVECKSANDDANGDKAGLIAGYVGEDAAIKGCTGADSRISSGRDAGQIVGAAKPACVTGCSATNVKVTGNGTSTGNNIREEVIGREL